MVDQYDGPNTDSSQSKKSGKKKKSMPPVSIEEVFNHVSTMTASNINPPPSKILLTPRSAEVCLKLGLNPEVLKIRDIDSFWEANIDPAVQRMRHEAYVQRRHDLMKQCRQERKKIMNAEFEAATNINPGSTMTPEMLLQQQKEQGATLIQMELQRIEKMQKRQEKELEQMIQYEINRAKIQQDMQQKIQQEKKREELRKKQQEKRLRLMAEERRLRELQRSAMEEAEEANRRELARMMHDKEVQMAEEKAKKLEDEKRRLREMEVEKKAKNEEQRLAVQKYFEEEQMKLRERLESMQVAEKKKQDAILARQQEHAENLRRKREMVEQRIEQNMNLARQIEEKRKRDFLEKQELFEVTRSEHLRRQEEERRLHAQEILLQEQRRKMILLQQRKEEDKKAEQMLEKFEEEEVHVIEVQQIRERERDLVREKKSLKTQMKLENVERVMRMQDFKRMSTLKKIEDTDSRVKTMVTQRQSLIEDRRKASAATKRQKEAIAKVMEEVRTNASKANKLIAQTLSGKVSIADIAQGMASTGKSHTRSSSASPGKHVKKNKTTSDLLGLGRDTRSAQSGTDDVIGEGFPVESGEHKYFAPGQDSTGPKPYISPYDSIQ